MTADQRLDQLEPLVSQTLAVADRHTAQLKQIYGAVNQLLEAGQMQSDNTQFVLREVSELRQDMNREIGGVKKEMQELKEEVSQAQSMTNLRLGVMENSLSIVGVKVTDLDAKLDRILGLLSDSK
ncbi:hypothetical protein [Hymenobacter terricola]|uniref:hypothetical protein n=1 Tax=Hymenobacter terricola TaxID=2819236 RepID=UPI001B30E456|nr:hypothetical protein [Hymenobacter terricola]